MGNFQNGWWLEQCRYCQLEVRATTLEDACRLLYEHILCSHLKGIDPMDDENTAEVAEDEIPLELFQWWYQDSGNMAQATVAKMLEYGSGDLVAIGRQITQMTGRPLGSPAQMMELGCMFYLLGKVARLQSAIEDGRDPSDDTWLDIEVYAKMVRAARAGAWPLPS